MKENELLSEIETLTKKISSLTPGTQIYEMMVEHYNTAQEAYQEQMMIKSYSNMKDQVINIGEMEETVHTPDYSKKELLDAVVTEYISNPRE